MTIHIAYAANTNYGLCRDEHCVWLSRLNSNAQRDLRRTGIQDMCDRQARDDTDMVADFAFRRGSSGPRRRLSPYQGHMLQSRTALSLTLAIWVAGIAEVMRRHKDRFRRRMGTQGN